ncbi:MAG: DUF3320 domain-containing protein, partial [Bacilli bacterium]|nr:DUF3320 domain-containing protein [Bacilli bacterium]
VIRSICLRIEDIRANPENYAHAAEVNQQMDIEFETKEIEKVQYGKPYVAFTKVYAGVSDIAAKLQIIREIMAVEAPISEEVLRNRFANAMGLARAGQTVQSDMKQCLSLLGAKKNKNGAGTKVFYWRPDQTTGLDYYRLGGEKPRSMDDVPKEEIIVAISEVLTNYGPMFKDELKRYVARVFEIKAVGRKVDEALDDCVSFYLEKGYLALVDNASRIALKAQEKK